MRGLIQQLDGLVSDPRQGLPQDLFYFVSRLTPLLNVDLLIQDARGRTLLVWRDDEFYRGWHIAGGIIRFKELAADRIKAVAALELGTTVEADPEPITILEKINCQRDVRGHFISLLYRCRLTSSLDEQRCCTNLDAPRHGEWAWHCHGPANLIAAHEVYRRFLSVQHTDRGSIASSQIGK